jgi:hypothetical protein
VIRNPFRRAVTVPPPVLEAAALAAGEKALAGTETEDGTWLVGTRRALHVVPAGGGGLRIPWERVERADWDRDEQRLVVAEVGEFGRERPQHTFAVAEPGVLLELLRERVTASVVLQRRVLTDGSRGLRVIARRSPEGSGELTWVYEFDAGVDPDDPAVRVAAEEALRAAQAELGL